MKIRLRNFLLPYFNGTTGQNGVGVSKAAGLLAALFFFVYSPVYSQCSCASPITSGTIASGTTSCVSTSTALGITVNGTLLITGTAITVSNITMGSGGVVEICGTGNTITFNTIANSSQLIIDPSGTGNTISQLTQSSGIFTLTNNLTATNALTISTATVNAVSGVSFAGASNGSFIHAGGGTTNMSGGIQGPNGNSYTLTINGGTLNLGSDANSRSVDYQLGNGGSNDIINIASGAKLITTGSLDYGSNVSTGGGLYNLGTASIGKNVNGYSIIKRSGNNVPFINGSSINSNTTLLMAGAMDVSAGQGSYINYGIWSIGVSTGAGADGSANGTGMSFNANQASQVLINNSTGTFTLAGGFRTGGGTAWLLANYGNMQVGRVAAFGATTNTSVYSGDYMTITNGSPSFPSAILTFAGTIYTTTTNPFIINNYACITARNLVSVNGNSITLNLYGSSNLNFTGTNSLTVSSVSGTTVNYTSNSEVAVGDVVTNTASGIQYINNVASATTATINANTALVGTYNTVYSLISNLGSNTFTLATAATPSGTANIQFAGVGIRSGNVTKTGTGTLTEYRNGTTNMVTSVTTDIPTGINTSICGAVITGINTLNAVNTCQGAASVPTVFSVSGINMTTGILVTPPSGFEVSLSSGSGYASTLTVPLVTSGSTGNVPGRLVYIRLAAATVAGTYSGNIALSASGAATVNLAMPSSVVGSVATVTLSSPSPDVAAAAGNTCSRTVNDPVFNFQMAVASSNGILNQVNFTTTGTATGSDILDYKLWYNPLSNSLTGATQIGSTITTSTGAGTHSFAGIGQSMAAGTTGYFIITMDVTSGATAGRTIAVSQMPAANISFQCGGTISGATTAGGAGIQTIATSGLTVTPTSSLNPAYYGNNVTLSAGATGGSGSYTYSWSSNQPAFSGTTSTSIATVTPTISPIVASVLVGDGYCFLSGSINEAVSIPYVGYTNGIGVYNTNTANAPSIAGYTIPGNTIYVYNYNTGTAPLTGSTNGALDYADGDAASNGGGNYRSNTGVDFENSGGIYDVSNTNAGEFLAFTVNIAAGTYNVTFNVANGGGAVASGSAFKLQLDGVDLAGSSTAAVASTGGWSTYQDVVISGVVVPSSGIHTLKFVEIGGGYNIRSITFGCPAPTAAVLSPATATICSGGTVNLAVAITGGSSPFTVKYTDGTTTFTVTNYISGAAIPVTLTSGKTYSLVSVVTSCGSAATGLSGSAIMTVSATPPNVVLAAPSPNLSSASGNTCKGGVSDPVYNFKVSATASAATVTQVNFTTTGTHIATDISNYKLWFNASSNSLTGATQIGANIISGTGAGAHSFTGLSQSIAVNTTGYFIITADIASGAATNATLQVSAFSTTNVVLACSGTYTGSAVAGGVQMISGGTITVSPTSSLNPAYYGSSVTLSSGITNTMGGTPTYSWSSNPVAFTGTGSTSTAVLTPATNSMIATVVATNGYCVVSGSITQIISTPYGGTAQIIPGRVQAELYDVGGEGIAYHEVASDGYTAENNIGSFYGQTTFRTAATGNGVDNYIETYAPYDTAVAWIRYGEWIKYSINATVAGTYTVSGFMATDGTTTKYMDIYIDGAYAGTVGDLTVNTGTYTNSSTFNIPLTAGPHLVQAGFNGTLYPSGQYEYFNLDYITFCLPPTPYNVTGSGVYCSVGGAGLPVGLDNSQIGVNYQLMSGATPIGSIVAGTGAAISFGYQTAGTYTVTGTAATGVCVTSMTGSAIVIASLPGGTWLGATSTDWNDATNWCGGVPNKTINATIPIVATGFYPLLSTGAGATKNISISSGATVTVTGTAVLSIAGNISDTGTNNINIITGTLQMNGAAAQVLDGSWFKNRTINNLIDSNVALSLIATPSDTLNITGTFSFGKINSATFTTHNNLTLKSTVAKTACIADITNGNTNTGNSIADSVIVERYFPAHRAWRLVTAPISASGAPSMNKAWQEGLINPDRFHPAYTSNYGTIITKSTAPINGYDAGSTSNPSIYSYNGSTWSAPAATNTGHITDKPGYLLFVRGSRNYYVTDEYQPATVATLRVKGLLNQNSIPISGNGITVIGNPYASTINYSGIFSRSVHLAATYYIWDPFTTGTNSTGSFITMHDDGGGSYSAIPDPTDLNPLNDATRHPIDKDGSIQSGQAFIVYFTNGDPSAVPGAASGAGSSSIEEKDKNTKSDNYVFRPAAPVEGIVEKFRTNLYAVNNDGTTSLEDGVLNLYNNGYSNILNYLEDAPKLGNIYETIGLLRDTHSQAIEARKIIGTTDTIYYSLFNMQKKSYILQFEASGLNHTGLQGFLVDSFLHTRTPIDLNGNTNVTFTVNTIAASSAKNRFTVLFVPIEGGALPVTFTSIKAVEQKDGNIAVQWLVANEVNIHSYQIEKSTDGKNFVPVNNTAAFGNNMSSNIYNWIDSNATSGNNYYRIVSVGINNDKEYSTVAEVEIRTIENKSIGVFPNPVKDNVIRVQFSNIRKGVYTFCLKNDIGQHLLNGTINHSGGNAVHTIQTGGSFAKGIYIIEITDADNTRQSIKLIIQ